VNGGKPGGNPALQSIESGADLKLTPSLAHANDNARATLPQDWVDGYRRGLDAGIEAGLAVGWSQGWAAHAELIDRWLGITREALKAPTQDELAKAREHTNEPCRTRCGRCSRCIRADAVARNLRRYCSPDYPGTRGQSRPS